MAIDLKLQVPQRAYHNNETVRVSWARQTGISRYEVLVRFRKNGYSQQRNFVLYQETQFNFQTDHYEGRSFDVSLTAYWNDGGQITQSKSVQVTGNAKPPATLRISKTAAKVGDSIIVSWSEGENADYYLLKRHLWHDGLFKTEQIHRTTAAGNYTDTMKNGWTKVQYELIAGEHYAVHTTGVRSETVTVSAASPPSPPSPSTPKPGYISVSKTTAKKGERITLSFPSASYQGEYQILRKYGGLWERIYTLSGTVSRYEDTLPSTLSAGDRVQYGIANAGQGSPFVTSSVISIVADAPSPPPPPPPPSPKPKPQNPATLRVSKTMAKAGDQIRVSWDSASYASEYRLYRSVDGGSAGKIHTVGGSGSYTDRIQEGWKTVRYSMDTFGNDQASSGYTYSETVTILSNQAPVISGSDQDLGSKSDAFQVTYSVSDANEQDSITVIERLSGTVLNTKQNVARDTAQTVEITAEKLSTLPLGNTQTIEIEAIDSSGNRSYRRYSFRRTNTPPKISGEDTNLGVKSAPFEVRFTATEQENEAMTGKILLNGKVVKEYAQVVAGQEYAFTLPKLEFAQLNAKDTHRLIIEVKDASGSIARRVYSFVRAVSRIYYEFKKETTQKVSVVMVTPNWHIAEGAIPKVEACNNALDEAPTWEDITGVVKEKKYHSFANQTKTAEKWALGVRLEVKKGAATEISYLVGIGGAYK